MSAAHVAAHPTRNSRERGQVPEQREVVESQSHRDRAIASASNRGVDYFVRAPRESVRAHFVFQ